MHCGVFAIANATAIYIAHGVTIRFMLLLMRKAPHELFQFMVHLIKLLFQFYGLFIVTKKMVTFDWVASSF